MFVPATIGNEVELHRATMGKYAYLPQGKYRLGGLATRQNEFTDCLKHSKVA
jgi:hypothetical protein